MMPLVRLAARNVTRNKWRSALSALALVIGVAQMIFGQSLISGVLRGIIEDAVKTKLGAIQIYRRGYLDAEQDPLRFQLPDDPALIAAMRTVPGVRAVTRRIQLEGMLSNGSIAAMFVATAIDPATEYDVCPGRKALVAPGSSPLSSADPSGILLGGALAEGLGAGAGATLVASAASVAGATNALDVSVVGRLPESGGYFENKAAALLPLSLTQSLLRMPGQVTEYVLDVEDLQAVDSVAQALRGRLGPDYDVRSWRDRPQIRQMVKTMAVVQGFIGFLLAVLVVSVIANTMLMNIYERVPEIGTMMALGVRRRAILGLFLYESALIGGLGALTGVALGLVFVRLGGIGFHMPATAVAGELTIYPVLSYAFVAETFVAGVVIAAAAALYPARQAAQLRPVEALRAT